MSDRRDQAEEELLRDREQERRDRHAPAHLSELERAKRYGSRLGNGCYAYQGSVHVDLTEFIVACGGDPENPVDVERAERVVQDVAGSQAIATEVRSDA